MATKSPGRRSKEFSIEFDQKKLNQLFDDLEQQMGAVTFKNIVRGEAAAILLRAAQLTGKASKKKILARAGLEKRARYLSQGGRWITRNAKLLAKRKAVLAEKLRRIGGAKDGWLSIIRQMKLKPANANQAKGLTALMNKRRPMVDGKPIIHRNTGGREIIQGKGSYAIEVRYGNPVGRWTRASPALRSAVNGRKSFFRKNLKEGVFFSARDIAKKYPGIEINKQ
jgi:hypothetical protein